MVNNLDILEEELLGDDGLIISLRFAKGLDEDKVLNICSTLKKLSKEWEKMDSIPKKAADLFIDFYPTVEAACELYDEEVKIRIMDSVDKIMDLMRDCLIN